MWGLALLDEDLVFSRTKKGISGIFEKNFVALRRQYGDRNDGAHGGLTLHPG
jgi:hypothetical protein